jgi:LysM repeat protein
MPSPRRWVCFAATVIGVAACGDDGAAPSGTLPPIVTVATTSTTSTVAGVVQQQFYVIKAGDTLGVIARNFGVTEQALMELNAIADPNHIEEGQTIEIPGPAAAAAGSSSSAPTPGT